MPNVFYILGDSIIMHVKGCDISSSHENCKVYVKYFPGATVRCMYDHVLQTLRENLDHIILHVGTSDLATNAPAEKTVESILTWLLH